MVVVEGSAAAEAIAVGGEVGDDKNRQALERGVAGDTAVTQLTH